MPAISRFLGIVIAMFFDDHGPPHFHARHADGSAKIRIDKLHQEELLENWRLARAGETLQEIDPLQ